MARGEWNPFSEKLGVYPACGRPIVFLLCPQDVLNVYHSSPGRAPGLQEMGYTGIKPLLLPLLSMV